MPGGFLTHDLRHPAILLACRGALEQQPFHQPHPAHAGRVLLIVAGLGEESFVERLRACGLKRMRARQKEYELDAGDAEDRVAAALDESDRE
ncbi:hypothetical protein JIG36_33880 [Actinoplanes sp. LDG1-06]|uniref:Uncharacterized protein n=1 Tax=Paractinoplanes ovalisporus TaxID=2810368 RepID=A0ABS2AMR6_9ACTN|nr:hypothetical protein [Actinoplanes ovalisporus]